jgi:MoxR-like ATPase
MSDWYLFTGSKQPHDRIRQLDATENQPPPWRIFHGGPVISEHQRWPRDRRGQIIQRGLDVLAQRGRAYEAGEREKALVNAAIQLRRPLLIEGDPGVGKSSLAYAVAYELRLGPVLHWPITSRTTLQDGLYRYDAVARLQDTARQSAGDIGDYIRLGPLGTAMLPWRYPRVLLIDELDKSDIDLPNDLLTIFEEGEFVIPELARLSQERSVQVFRSDSDAQVEIVGGQVRCRAFPIVLMTSNNERTFPPAFLRRCLRLEIRQPTSAQLESIVANHFRLGPGDRARIEELIASFLSRRQEGRQLATDQLLNAIHLRLNGKLEPNGTSAELLEHVLAALSGEQL